MRLLPYRLVLATVLGAMSWHPDARADDYDRLVRLEWEPIAGAVSYEIEWVKGEDCGVSLGIEKVSQAAWKKELPAGNYCTRVRGISAGERPGFWTEFQKLTVKPKPPRFIKSTDEGKFEWDTVPYAKSYLVEVVDPAGKSVLQKEVTDTSFELPNEILKDQRYVTREKFKISVRTLTEKVPRSALREVTFQTTLPPPTPVPTPASVAKAKPAGAAQSASAPEPVPPRSLPPQPAPERAVVEALEDWRYARGLTASGERPLAPSKEEWAAAKTPEQKEVLRRRTIASARVDLEEELLQRRSTETRFLAGVGYASGFFRSSTDKDRPSTDHRGGGIHQQLEIQHNRGGAWGLFADFAERSVSGEGVKHVFYSASAGVERNFGLDSLWHSRVSLRFGLQYSSHPVEGSGNNSSDSGTFSYPMSTLGVVFGAEHQYAINHRWSWLTSVNARLAPPQTNVDGLLEKVSLLGLSVRTGAEYKFTPELGARAGFVLSGSRAEADEETGIRSQLVDLGIVLQGVYSLSPGSGRAVASESVHQSDLRRLWSARAALKLGARRFTNITFSSEVPEPLSGADLRNRLGADLALERRFSSESRWGVGATLSSSPDELSVGGYGSYSLPLFRRKDSTIRLLGGMGSRVASAYQASARSIQAIDARMGVGFDQSLGRSFALKLDAGVDLPLLVYPGENLGFPSDGKVSPDGFNYAWRVGASVGYRLLPAIGAWGGVQMNQLKYSLRSTTETSIATEVIGYSETQFSLGLSLDW